MSKKNEQGIVIGTKDEALWTKVKETTEFRISSLERESIQLYKQVEEVNNELRVNREMKKLCEHRILLEKRK